MIDCLNDGAGSRRIRACGRGRERDPDHGRVQGEASGRR